MEAPMTGISNARLLKVADVIERVSFCRSTLYSKVAAGEFPAPVRISENRVAWDSRVIDAWISEKLATA